MKIIMNQPEIEAILRKHIDENIQLSAGSDFKIEFTATRSDDGIVASIDVPYLGVSRLPGFDTTKAEDKPAETKSTPAPATTGADAPTSTSAPAAAAPATIPKIDGRSKEARAAKQQGKPNIFANSNDAPKTGAAPVDAVDRAVHEITREPTSQEVAAARGDVPDRQDIELPVDETDIANRAAEAKEILSQSDDDTPTPSEVEEEEAPPPPSTGQRKSLFN